MFVDFSPGGKGGRGHTRKEEETFCWLPKTKRTSSLLPPSLPWRQRRRGAEKEGEQRAALQSRKGGERRGANGNHKYEISLGGRGEGEREAEAEETPFLQTRVSPSPPLPKTLSATLSGGSGGGGLGLASLLQHTRTYARIPFKTLLLLHFSFASAARNIGGRKEKYFWRGIQSNRKEETRQR